MVQFRSFPWVPGSRAQRPLLPLRPLSSDFRGLECSAVAPSPRSLQLWTSSATVPTRKRAMHWALTKAEHCFAVTLGPSVCFHSFAQRRPNK